MAQSKKRTASRPTLSPTLVSTQKKNLYPLKDQFRCLFCGGKNCPHEDYTKHKNPAIHGLHSDLLDDCIYASQRPSNFLIKKYELIKTFKDKNIGLIINLQRPGEHPYCGPNKLDLMTGYSYNPSLFSSEGIRVKLSGWKDMDVPDSLYFMLDIIKDMAHTIHVDKKRVFVHCHAGYGRTGVVLACYKIFNDNLTAEEAVKRLRMVRSKCIEQKSQMSYCRKFYQCKNIYLLFTSHDQVKGNFSIRKNRHKCIFKTPM